MHRVAVPVRGKHRILFNQLSIIQRRISSKNTSKCGNRFDTIRIIGATTMFTQYTRSCAKTHEPFTNHKTTKSLTIILGCLLMLIVLGTTTKAQAESYMYPVEEESTTIEPAGPTEEDILEEVDGEIRFESFPVNSINDMVYFSDSWGAPRSGGRRHKGNDIHAPKGSVVVAAEDGVVKRIDWNRLSGNLIEIDHGNGWSTVYMHLNNDRPGTDDGDAYGWQTYAISLNEGDCVEAGQLVAYVGDSGNAEGTVPHVHFEIRKNGKPVDPYDVLIESWGERENGVEWFDQLSQGSQAFTQGWEPAMELPTVTTERIPALEDLELADL